MRPRLGPAGSSRALLCLLIAGVAGTAATTHAQTRPKWEVEVHGTLATPTGAPSGQSNAPLSGQTFVLGDGLTSSRMVPSWYFGDGTRLLNQVLQLRGLTTQLSALDRVAWPAASRRSGPQIGARIARQAAGNLWLEFSFDLGLDSLGFDSAAESQIETTRAEFITAFTALFNSTSTLLPNPAITSTATIGSGGRRAITTAVVQYRGSGEGLVPYVLAGSGYASPVGKPASLTLVGNYVLTTPGQAVIDETDTMRLDYHASGSLVWVAGFGLMKARSEGAGFRFDLRMQFSSTQLRADLYTMPASRITSPTGAAILNATGPGLQFSSTELRTNLSGTAWDGFEAFTGSSRSMQWVISAGYYLRF